MAATQTTASKTDLCVKTNLYPAPIFFPHLALDRSCDLSFVLVGVLTSILDYLSWGGWYTFHFLGLLPLLGLALLSSSQENPSQLSPLLRESTGQNTAETIALIKKIEKSSLPTETKWKSLCLVFTSKSRVRCGTPARGNLVSPNIDTRNDGFDQDASLPSA
jgi:hypothetical protein